MYKMPVILKKESVFSYEKTDSTKLAATYSSTSRGSTIGARGLNCSVRNGKRCDPAAIATLMAWP